VPVLLPQLWGQIDAAPPRAAAAQQEAEDAVIIESVSDNLGVGLVPRSEVADQFVGLLLAGGDFPSHIPRRLHSKSGSP
jgi:hypothetical protein